MQIGKDNLVDCEVAAPYLEALRQKVIEEKLKIGGDGHQDDHVPVFSDETVGSFSYRAWGDFMAAVWSTEEDKDYGYFDFYMDTTIPKEES